MAESRIPTATLGTTGIPITAIGVGGWLGELEDPEATDDQRIEAAIDTVRRAVELGGVLLRQFPRLWPHAGRSGAMARTWAADAFRGEAGRPDDLHEGGHRRQEITSVRCGFGSLVAGAESEATAARQGRYHPTSTIPAPTSRWMRSWRPEGPSRRWKA